MRIWESRYTEREVSKSEEEMTRWDERGWEWRDEKICRLGDGEGPMEGA